MSFSLENVAGELPPRRYTGALLRTDIVGSTPKTRRLTDPIYRAQLQRHNALIESAYKAEVSSRKVKDEGDAYFVLFETAGEAVRAALRVQHSVTLEPWNGEPLQVAMAVYGGEFEVYERDGGRADLVGDAINMASRLHANAQPNQILLNRAAYDMARATLGESLSWSMDRDGTPLKLKIRWVNHGSRAFKGDIDPVSGVQQHQEVYEAGLEGVAPFISPKTGPLAGRRKWPRLLHRRIQLGLAAAVALAAVGSWWLMVAGRRQTTVDLVIRPQDYPWSALTPPQQVAAAECLAAFSRAGAEVVSLTVRVSADSVLTSPAKSPRSLTLDFVSESSPGFRAPELQTWADVIKALDKSASETGSESRVRWVVGGHQSPPLSTISISQALRSIVEPSDSPELSISQQREANAIVKSLLATRQALEHGGTLELVGCEGDTNDLARRLAVLLPGTTVVTYGPREPIGDAHAVRARPAREVDESEHPAEER